MSALSLISKINQSGGELFVDDGCLKLGIRKGCSIPDALLAKAKRHKADILATLTRKPNLPAIWDVTVMNQGKPTTMTVIDPKRDIDDVFIRGLHDRFGVDRVISAKKRNKQL